jgi:periplasmic divalent cation tolerance protein
MLTREAVQAYKTWEGDSMTPKYIQVSTTTAKRQQADKIAKALVEMKLAACAQVLGPITSTYRWKGRVEVAKEWLCLIKTAGGRYRQVEKAIRSLHPYETPEIVAVPIVRGSKDYLAWLACHVRIPGS